MYNKEAVLEAKLNKKLSSNKATEHIHSLSDVKELKLTDNKAWKDNGPEKGDIYIGWPLNGLNGIERGKHFSIF